ncbi:hypothetical protein SCALIN_C01_0133 [Candidatus Scalindua japonica]|uniref:Uncharacterized protein n=1 Tax=Candidatus Scalindua japonica TaxID=1284222 RepID=A0A286TTI1_9BACT|nr:hypothetical protein [Candidatus Scalindua japonica]GAX59202.1 hypothetical protein SCALIN_C01_0133 [Candidatus Scalindua japonica]
MKLNIFNVIIFPFVVMMVFPGVSFSWFNDPLLNTSVAPNTNIQVEQTAIVDGNGGTIISWSEQAAGGTGEFDIYAQRLDSKGKPLWPSPVAVCTASFDQGSPAMIGDEFGGAIIIWGDRREVANGSPDELDIYAQRINGNGQVQWATDGIPVSTASGWQTNQVIAPDGLGGAYIAWDDYRDGNHVYAQRVDQNGQTIWQENGLIMRDVPPSTSFHQVKPDIVSDGLGGVFIVWTDYQPVSLTNIFAQKLDHDGNKLWGIEGLAICTELEAQFDAYVASDGFGGAIFTWTDGRLGNNDLDIYAQRVDVGGNLHWQVQGVPIVTIQENQFVNAMVSDGGGGAILVWSDTRKQNGDTDIYAQRVSAQGALIWDIGGMPVATTDDLQSNPVLISDGLGGAFITWQDFFRGGTMWNVYSQHVDGSGLPMWIVDGIAVSIADETQNNPLIIPDGSGGFINIWSDDRSGTYTNIFAQQVDNRGLLGGGKFLYYTADKDRNPKTVFTQEELIRFTSSWTEAAPLTPGTYQAASIMIINNFTDFRHETVTYDVIP